MFRLFILLSSNVLPIKYKLQIKIAHNNITSKNLCPVSSPFFSIETNPDF